MLVDVARVRGAPVPRDDERVGRERLSSVSDCAASELAGHEVTDHGQGREGRTSDNLALSSRAMCQPQGEG